MYLLKEPSGRFSCLLLSPLSFKETQANCFCFVLFNVFITTLLKKKQNTTHVSRVGEQCLVQCHLIRTTVDSRRKSYARLQRGMN